MTARARRIFLAALGSIYVIAFASLWVQVDGLIGERGILPAGSFLDAVSDSLGTQAWWRLPTLAWLTGASDAVLHSFCGMGVVSGLLLALGYLPLLAAFACWTLYLSLYSLSRDFLGFQWDILLLETGFLAILYAPGTALRPQSASWSESPPRLVVWLLRLLVAKLMFLSGVVKLSSGDPTWWNLTALSYHYETTCLPTWTGWIAHQLPLSLHRLSGLGMFAIELLLPFAILLGPRGRRLAAIGFAGLMLGIAATGNYGFFNLLAMALCIPLLDGDAAPAPASSSRAAVLGRLARAAVAIPILTLSLLPAVRAFRIAVSWPSTVLSVQEALAPFAIVNGYGLFARMTTQRPEIEIEGSDDGIEWKPYRFRWKPGEVKSRPRFVQPHMPRLDWLLWFAALSNYQNTPWFLAFVERLLAGSPAVLGLLAENPFPGGPPRLLRAQLYDYRFTSIGASTDWWQRTWQREYLPPVERDQTGRLRRAS